MPQDKLDYNQTLNLPKTSFDMRAGLPKKEPKFIEHWNEMYNLAVMKVAVSRNAPVLDVRSAFLCRRAFDALFSSDGIHPSVEGHRKMYEFLLPQFKTVLA